jgi:hypothetical protein
MGDRQQLQTAHSRLQPAWKSLLQPNRLGRHLQQTRRGHLHLRPRLDLMTIFLRRRHRSDQSRRPQIPRTLSLSLPPHRYYHYQRHRLLGRKQRQVKVMRSSRMSANRRGTIISYLYSSKPK